MSNDIKAIKARLNSATPGPWYLQANDLIGGWCVRTVDTPPSEGPGEVADFIREEDARFIASAPADIAALVAEVERLRAWIGHGHMHQHPADILREIDRAMLDRVERAVQAVASFPALDANTIRSEVIDAVSEQVYDTAYDTKEAAARVVLDAAEDMTREEIAVEIRCLG